MNCEEDKLIFKSFMAFVSGLDFFDKDVLEAIADEDDVVGAYVVNSIKQLYEEYESHKIWLDEKKAVGEFAAEMDGFLEVMDAYLVGFGGLDRSQIVNWLIGLKKELDLLLQPVQTIPSTQEESKPAATSASKQQETNKTPKKDETPSFERELAALKLDESKDFKQLAEMFPSMSQKKVFGVFKKANKNYEQAIDRLLELQDQGSSDDERTTVRRSDLELTEEERRLLKEKTIQKFGFVPVVEGEQAPCKPVTKWETDKKMVRYYESKVVTTKGEKFFELKTEEDEEAAKQMKKTFINLKPARKYRFH